MRRARTFAVACAAGAIATWASLSSADTITYPPQCGGEHEVVSSHHPRGRRPPLAIGDSTMLLALYDLGAAGFDANAQGCRQYDQALVMIRQRKAAGTLPHMVIVALGADGSITHTDIGETLGLLCCTHLLVLVTPRELGGGSGSDAATVREEGQKHPKRIRGSTGSPTAPATRAGSSPTGCT